MVFVMLFTWQVSGDSKYQLPLIKSLEAEYSSSNLKMQVDQANDGLKHRYPLITAVAPTSYAVFVKKQALVTTKKLSLLPNTVSTYAFSQSSKTGSVNITWSF